MFIQIILKDGTKRRFNFKPDKWDEFGFTQDDILFHKEFDDEDVLKIPDWSSGELILRDKNADELKAEQDIKDLKKAEADYEKAIQNKMREMAIAELEKENNNK